MARNWDKYARGKDGKVETKKENGVISWRLKNGKWEMQKKRVRYRKLDQTPFNKATRIVLAILTEYAKSKHFWQQVKRAEKVSII